jgi:NAD(P)-dependent dehydrogenase (short-subunit alcohol dehydrogenase family)
MTITNTTLGEGKIYISLACRWQRGTCSIVMQVLNLSGKSIVIVGGTTGLGFSAALCFVRNGARVAIVGRDPDHANAARKKLGHTARVLIGDAIDPATAARAIDLAVREFGRLDGLYHVAGGSGRAWGDGPLHEMTDEGWRKTIEWNLDSVMYSNRAALRRFLEQRSGGSILNMGSVLADSPAPPYFSTHAYASAKAAIVGLSKSVAACYATHGIRCNVIEPAVTDTPMAKRATSNKRILRVIKAKQPLDGGRVGQPADLDGAAAYIMSDASKFTTGQVLAVDGGWSLA